MVSIIVSKLKSVKNIYYNIYNELREQDYKANQLSQSMWCLFIILKNKRVRAREE